MKNTINGCSNEIFKKTVKKGESDTSMELVDMAKIDFEMHHQSTTSSVEHKKDDKHYMKYYMYLPLYYHVVVLILQARQLKHEWFSLQQVFYVVVASKIKTNHSQGVMKRLSF